MTRRALITGITGMVGSHLADYLYKNTDWRIVGMARWRSPLDNLENLAAAINDGERVRLLYGDLRDGVAVRHVCAKHLPMLFFIWRRKGFPRTSFESPFGYF